MRKAAEALGRECAAEFIGTYVLVFFGTGVVHAAVLAGSQAGLWQVAVVWGVAISLAIYATGSVSGSHINPAITLAFAAYREFPKRKIAPYVLAQLLGAFAAAATLYGLFCNILARFELAHHIVRGEAGSELSAMVYGEYFPNPALLGTTTEALASVSLLQAMLAEGIGTAFLAFFVFAVTDVRNRGRPRGGTFAVFIGLTVSIVISVIAPLTQAGLNPARDFGPRVFSWLAGWGTIAIPGPRGGVFTVYILAPLLGALVGAAVYQFVLRPRTISAHFRMRPIEEENPVTQRIRLILVGGFLGAGKTTLLARAARHLASTGRKVGIITNDQAPGLVDTEIVKQETQGVREVSGGCFCCRFGDLVSALKGLLKDFSPDVVLAEPVGSCTDLSATVLQPMKKLYSEVVAVTPFSVLLDPVRLREVLAPDAASLFPESVHYIFRKQMEEADLLVLNKADLLSDDERRSLEEMVREHYPGSPLMVMSALSDADVQTWLDRVSADDPAGQRIAEVDYDTYARGEAELGWLNATVQMRSDGKTDWRRFCLDLIGEIQARLVARSADVAHLKLHLSVPGGALAANLTHLSGRATVQGEIRGTPRESRLIVNARTHLAPDQLQSLVEESLRTTAGESVATEVSALRSFRPGRPEPTHRFDRVV